jgi:hypothetical protein
MKKIIYIFISISSFFLFKGNLGGPVSVQQTGYTGSPVDQSSTCNSCHSGGAYDASASIEVFNDAGTTAVSSYQLNQQYTIRLTIAVSSGSPAGYGFNMIDLQQSNNKNVKGFLPTAQQATGIGIRQISATGNIYAEHSSRITSKIINVKWKAPSTNLGTIVFYAAANAVNSNGSESGDSPTAGVSFQLPAAPTGTYDISDKINIELSPNPTPSMVSVALDSKSAKSLKIQVTDMTGRTVLSENWAVTVGQNQRSLDFNTFAKGAYMVQIIDNQDVISKKILKF